MSERPIRVLHLLTALGHGGAETWLLNMIAPLRTLGIDVGFVLKAPEMGKLRHVAEERGAPTYEVRLDPTFRRYVSGIADLTRRERYDIVHTHEFVHSAAGVVAAKIARRPSVVTFHHFTFEAQTALTRRLGMRQLRHAYGRASVALTIRAADRITAMTDAVMARLLPDYRSNPKCTILHLSVGSRSRASDEERRALRRELGLAPDAALVIHAGRYIEQKNHAGLLRVFREIHRQVSRARLLLLGQGPLESEVRRLAADLTSAGLVQFLGVRNDVDRLMANADLCLFPSLHEGFGLVALEANACELPVVATRVPGLEEALVDGKTALLHDVDDEAGMARSSVELLETPSRARALGVAGRARADAEYSHLASARRLADVYRDVLGNGASRRVG